MSVTGQSRPYTVSGNMNFFNGSYKRDFDFTPIDISKPDRVSELLAVYKKQKNWFDFDLKIKTGSDLLIRNNTFRGEITFDLNLKGTEKLPKLLGSINLLNGKLSYLDNEFDLTSGRFKFKEEDVVYQLDAEAKVKEYQVYLNVLGQGENPKFKLNSLPSLSEDRIMALLITGEADTELNRETGYNLVGAGGGFFAGNLGVTGALSDKAGVHVSVKSAVSKDDTTHPQLEVRKKLTDDVKFIYGKSLDETVNKQEFNVQYDVNKNVQLKLLLEEDNTQSVNKEPSNAGVDVRFKFEF
jgi:autotransporter translocation and assembly factor TamB